jgi:glycogen debranching enzyme
MTSQRHDLVSSEPTPSEATRPLPIQPTIDQLVSCVHAPSAILSDVDGRIDAAGTRAATGFFLGEYRLLSKFVLRAFDRFPDLVHSALGSDGVLRITAIVRDGTEDTPDPVLLMRRSRQPNAAGFTEMISIRNYGTHQRRIPLVVAVAADLAPSSEVKAGRRSPRSLAARATGSGVEFDDAGYTLRIAAGPGAVVDLAAATLSWDVVVDAGETWNGTIDVIGTQPDDGAFRPPAATRIPWAMPTVATDDTSLALLVEWSFGDLRRLALADPVALDDTFIAAGCPWYFTLFGRDSLWTARMMMPFSTDLASSTLRALARRQGVRHDAHAAEQPGRIPHEVRPASLTVGDMQLPPVYYGSVDATPLWITTLAEAWRWGLADTDVEALLDALTAAVDWLVDNSDADDDGLCEYVNETGKGLGNQGWKDSGDSVNWHDGALAAAPIALVEVQGYAYEAAVNAIQLYEHFGLTGTERIARFAERLRVAFHAKFWLHDDRGPHLAIALDANKHAVDSTTSNPGHVLGTGLLSAEQEAAVVTRLMTELECGFGLRTMSDRDSRFNPLSYHNGSIWPHDTAICARGMVLSGHPAAAGTLIAGLLRATTAFDGRLPELFASIDVTAPIVPYPASCRPQAWAAALGPLALWAAAPLLPLERGKPPVGLPGIDLFPTLDIHGFRLDGAPISAQVRAGTPSFPDLEIVLDHTSYRSDARAGLQ